MQKEHMIVDTSTTISTGRGTKSYKKGFVQFEGCAIME